MVHGSASAFLDRSFSWLLEREAENNLIFGIALARREMESPEEEPAWFLTVEERGRVLGAAFRTPPHMLGLTDLPDGAVPMVARMVGQAFDHLPGVVGPEGPARALAEVWCAARPVRSEVEMRMGVRELRRLIPPARPVEGRLRHAGPRDRERLVEWMTGFEEATGIYSSGPADTVDRLLGAHALRVWEAEGIPVSMAGASGVTPNGVRIGYVYVPPEHRGKGFATAVTRAISEEFLGRGYRFCVLYVDRSDPVATGIYQRLGYQQISTAVSVRFLPTGEGHTTTATGEHES